MVDQHRRRSPDNAGDSDVNPYRLSDDPDPQRNDQNSDEFLRTFLGIDPEVHHQNVDYLGGIHSANGGGSYTLGVGTDGRIDHVMNTGPAQISIDITPEGGSIEIDDFGLSSGAVRTAQNSAREFLESITEVENPMISYTIL